MQDSLRLKVYKLLKKGEYVAASFYCREWLRSPLSKEGLFFKSLFEDEFLHWRYLALLTSELKIKSNEEAREVFIDQQKKIAGEQIGLPTKNIVTELSEVKYDFELTGLGGRFLVFQRVLNGRLTKDLKGEDKVGFIKVVDGSNHLLYKLLDLIDLKQDYSFFWKHPRKVDYEVKRSILAKWFVKYLLSILVYFPVDLYRILRTQIL